jgi:hypothetical protein
MNLFITLLENVNKSRTSANNVSLMYYTIYAYKLNLHVVHIFRFVLELFEVRRCNHALVGLRFFLRLTSLKFNQLILGGA